MANLMTVSQFAKQDQTGKWGTPQKINYAIRKQNAPFVEQNGKRYIDPEKWAEWENTGAQVVRQAKADGLSAGGVATRIQKLTGVTKGTMLAWKSGLNYEKISAGKVTEVNDYYASTMIDDCGISSPLGWESINRHIAEGNMMVVNHPEQLLYVLAHHYKGQGEEDTYNKLIELYDRHRTYEPGGGYKRV
ncbi:hypothetical protein [Weizmannia phage Youna2]